MNDDELLFHYTDAAGMMGLTGTPGLPPKIWLTQIQFMNDHAEIREIYDVAARFFAEQAKNFQGLREHAKGYYGIPSDPAGGGTKGHGFSRHMVFSLTEERDLLSQWRGYAPKGGYSVGFRFGDLDDLAKKHGFVLKPCVYDDEKKRELLLEILRHAEAAILAGEIDPEIREQKLAPELQVPATARLRLGRGLQAIAPLCKHSSFSEEREWRLVGIVPALHDARAKWRPKGKFVIPYAEIELQAETRSPLLVKEIIVGPGVDYDMASHAISFMNFQMFGEITVRPSGCTLR